MKSEKSFYKFFTLIEILIFHLLIGYTLKMVIWMFGYLGCGIFYSLQEGEKNPQELARVFLLQQAGIHLFFFIRNLYLFVRGSVPKVFPKQKIIYFLVTVVLAMALLGIVVKRATDFHCDLFLSPDDSGMLLACIISLIVNILYIWKTHQSLSMSLIDLIKK